MVSYLQREKESAPLGMVIVLLTVVLHNELEPNKAPWRRLIAVIPSYETEDVGTVEAINL
jgi:hypothetical protein